MDIKLRSSTKTPKTPALTEKKKQLEKDTKYTEKETKCIADMKKLYLDTIKLDVDLQHGIYNLEKSFESKHDIIYDKRLQLLENFKKHNQGGDPSEMGNVNNFWLKVLKASYTEFISKRDEKILVFLADIRSKLYNEPSVKFILEFYFEPNDYFTNRILTKTYFLNCLPDPDDPFSYDGAEIYKCEGCKIDWKNPEKEKEKKSFTSFFDFFDPPTLPENPNDPTYSDINAILQNDFELGFYLKERVIPKAVLFFTGEIADCLSSDSESESENDEDEETNEDELGSIAASTK
ncbi:nucleosome assembly protein 1-like 1 [Musca domestica]|uniref:Nucleosome assembly protein 1-like 1 n=1 Tax=Musca domestica TaxID=7370 RepID=A0A1I8M1S2_MUSDO|nr:nucleosome assembly protein 1-like 1 [Musca domestica]